MKKLYIVTALVLGAVLSVEAKKPCPSCIRQRQRIITAPAPKPAPQPAVAAAASWTAQQYKQVESEKIKQETDKAIAKVEADLKHYRAEGATEKIKKAEQELAKLKQIRSCAK